MTTDHDEAIEVTSEVEQEAAAVAEVEPAQADLTDAADEGASEVGSDAEHEIAEAGLSVQGALNVSEHELKPALEAVLMIADTPLDHLSLAQAVGATPDAVEAALAELSAEYTEQGRGFDLRMAGAGWRFYTREEFAPIIEQFVVDGQQARLTQAALETLAVVAYRQPVSRARVSAIRGVNVDGVMRTLLNRGLVEEAGSDQETGAHLYRTTSYFLERMGLTSLEQLPEIAPLLPEMTELDDDAELDEVLAES